MVGSQQLANGRVNARLSSADGLHFRARATHLVHIRGRPANVADRAREFGVRSHVADLFENGLLTARLDDASLMSGYRTECAAAETAAHDRHGILDHVIGWNRLGVTWMRSASVRQVVDSIHR